MNAQIRGALEDPIFGSRDGVEVDVELVPSQGERLTVVPCTIADVDDSVPEQTRAPRLDVEADGAVHDEVLLIDDEAGRPEVRDDLSRGAALASAQALIPSRAPHPVVGNDHGCVPGRPGGLEVERILRTGVLALRVWLARLVHIERGSDVEVVVVDDRSPDGPAYWVAGGTEDLHGIGAVAELVVDDPRPQRRILRACIDANAVKILSGVGAAVFDQGALEDVVVRLPCSIRRFPPRTM